VDVNYPSRQRFEVGGISCSRRLLNNVFLLYRQQFRHWFAITAPTSLIASVVLAIADRQIREIFSRIPRGRIPYPAELAQTFTLRFGSVFLTWLLGAFALGAIATVVCELDSDDSEVWRRDTHQLTREHFGTVFLIALFTFCIFLVGVVGAGVVLLPIAKHTSWARSHRFNFASSFVGVVVVAAIVSWFGMAIPLILRGNIGTWAALKRSVKLSNGYEGALFLLVIESVAGSYLAWYAALYGLALVVPPYLRHTDWYSWVVALVAVLAAAAVEPPLFIGFSLLAEESTQETAGARADTLVS
jgi:hypothetical protein